MSGQTLLVARHYMYTSESFLINPSILSDDSIVNQIGRGICLVENAEVMKQMRPEPNPASVLLASISAHENSF